ERVSRWFGYHSRADRAAAAGRAGGGAGAGPGSDHRCALHPARRAQPGHLAASHPAALEDDGGAGRQVHGRRDRRGDFLAGRADAMEMPGGDPGAMMERIGGTMFGVQFGHAIGSLAREMAGTTDLSLPLGREGEPAMVAANVEDLIAGHSLDPDAARIFLAAREL